MSCRTTALPVISDKTAVKVQVESRFTSSAIAQYTAVSYNTNGGNTPWYLWFGFGTENEAHGFFEEMDS